MNNTKRCSLILAISLSCFKGFAMEKDQYQKPCVKVDHTAQIITSNPVAKTMLKVDDEIDVALEALDTLSLKDESSENSVQSFIYAVSKVNKAKKPKSLQFYSPEQKVKRGMMRSSLGVTADEREGKKVCNALQKEYKKISKMDKEKKAQRTPSTKAKHSKPLSQFSFGTINE